MWWENLKKICLGTGLLNEWSLVDNIARRVGNRCLLSFGVTRGRWCFFRI